MIEILTSFLVVAGAILVCAGSFGVARCKDYFERVHAAGLPATLGLSLLLIASSIHLSAHLGEPFLKPIVVVAILFLTVPLGTEMLARAGYITNVKPAHEYARDDAEEQRELEHKEPVE